MRHTFLITDHLGDPGVREVDTGLGAYNDSVAEIAQVRPLAVLARGEGAGVSGGAVGRSWGECCELQQLWVCESMRGQGLGMELLHRFEDAARERGCRVVYLTTFSFQAPEFYARCGYRVVREMRGYPAGIVRHDMEKALSDRDRPPDGISFTHAPEVPFPPSSGQGSTTD